MELGQAPNSQKPIVDGVNLHALVASGVTHDLNQLSSALLSPEQAENDCGWGAEGASELNPLLKAHFN